MKTIRRFISKWNLMGRGILMILCMTRMYLVSIPTEFNRFHIYWTSGVSLNNVLVIITIISLIAVLFSDVCTIVKSANFIGEKH